MSQLLENSYLNDAIVDKPIYRPIFILASIFGVRMLGLFIILPVFAVYTQQFKDVTPFRVGLALGIYGLTQAIFQIPFGMGSDKFGRKPMIILGLLLFSLGSVIAASTDSIDGIIAGRFLQGSGAIGSVIMALAADLSHPSWRSRAMAIIGMTIGIAFVFAFILGPILTEVFQGIRGLFWLTAGLSLLCIGLISFLPTPVRVKNLEISNHQNTSSRISILKNKKLMIFNMGVLVIHASLTALFLKIPNLVESFGFVQGKAWQLYCPILLLSLGLSLPLLYCIDKLSSKSVIYLKSFLLFIMLILLGSELCIGFFSTHFLIFSLGLILFFTTFNVLEAGLPSLITHSVDKEVRGTVMGVYSSLQFLGLFLGGFLGGLLDNYYGFSAIIALCFILALIWFIICWLLF